MPTCGTGAFSLSPLEHISLFLHTYLKIDLGSLHQKAPRSTRFHSRGYWSSAKSDGRNGIYARFRSRKVIQRGHRVQNYFVAGPIDKSVCTWAQAGGPGWTFCAVQGDLSRNGNGRSRPIGAPSTTERATTGERKHPRSFLGPKTAIFSLQTPKTCFSASHHHCHRRPSAGARPAQMHQTTS